MRTVGLGSGIVNTMEPRTSAGIRIEQFPAGVEGDRPDARTGAWFEAVNFGFLDSTFEPAHAAVFARAYIEDGRTLWGAYDDGERPGVWNAEVPVATYATLVNDLNVGGGRMLPTHQITAVTVRATHRRRGILRQMMTEDLRQAAGKGLAMAALTASEATIYGRFGFGTATFTREVEVDVRERFALRAPATGTVEVAEPGTLVDLAPKVFARFHAQTRGSIGRQYGYAMRASGRWGGEKPEVDKGLRAAVHYSDGNSADGYVSYKFSGWDKKPRALKIVDLVAATGEAYRELWRYLGSVDLVETITFDAAAENDPLPWAMTDSRGYAVKGSEDVLWLRVLDTEAALRERAWATDGSLSVGVADPLGIASGRFRIVAEGGRASVERLAEDADVDAVLPVDVLGSLYLGGVSAETLAAAGRLPGTPADAVARLDAMFGAGGPPYCITHF
jgi:predicted acetyltransferase